MVLTGCEGRCWLNRATLPPSEGGSRAAAAAGADATTAPPWGAPVVQATLQQAHQLLLSSWFEPGFEAGLAAFLQGCGQQLPPRLDSDYDNRQLRMISLDCSEVWGLYFAAVWCDAATQQYCLVPTSVLRPPRL